ncbi:hypothetical protein D5086_013841 [Populus alba]|uniref:Uncharacterized protein n=1 Tax=Populus alba TaxID=43335 RepID=A0ACC4C651_POPAL
MVSYQSLQGDEGSELGELGSEYLLIGFRVIFNDLERTPPKPKSPDLVKFLYFDLSTEAHNALYELINSVTQKGRSDMIKNMTQAVEGDGDWMKVLLRLKAEGDGEERRCWEQGERLRREGQRAILAIIAKMRLMAALRLSSTNPMTITG